MRISFFIGRMEGGGAEKVISVLANYYVKCGNNVDLVLLLGPEVNNDLFHLSDQIRIIDMSSNRVGYISNLCHWFRSIRHYVRINKPDKIVSFIGRINALVLTATLGLNVPILVSERSNPKTDGRSFLMRKYCDIIYRRAAAIVFQTKFAQNCFSNKLNRISHIIPNPIEIIDINTTDVNNDLIVTAGRLQPEKNHAMLITAMGILHKQKPNVRCEIFGEGALRELLQSQIELENLDEVVTLPGVKNNLLEYEAKAKIFVLTSNYEGLSNALMEAMMLGKICISTDYDGVEDIINNGVDGIIIPRNDPQKLAEILLEVLDTDNYLFMRQNARKKMMSYSKPIILKQWDSVIQIM